MNRDQLHDLKELQKKNEQLRKAVADLTLISGAPGKYGDLIAVS
jgi:hypothetical protein